MPRNGWAEAVATFGCAVIPVTWVGIEKVWRKSKWPQRMKEPGLVIFGKPMHFPKYTGLEEPPQRKATRNMITREVWKQIVGNYKAAGYYRELALYDDENLA